jgi:hypothetical protein
LLIIKGSVFPTVEDGHEEAMQAKIAAIIALIRRLSRFIAFVGFTFPDCANRMDSRRNLF